MEENIEIVLMKKLTLLILKLREFKFAGLVPDIFTSIFFLAELSMQRYQLRIVKTGSYLIEN